MKENIYLVLPPPELAKKNLMIPHLIQVESEDDEHYYGLLLSPVDDLGEAVDDFVEVPKALCRKLDLFTPLGLACNGNHSH